MENLTKAVDKRDQDTNSSSTRAKSVKMSTPAADKDDRGPSSASVEKPIVSTAHPASVDDDTFEPDYDE